MPQASTGTTGKKSVFENMRGEYESTRRRKLGLGLGVEIGLEKVREISGIVGYFLGQREEVLDAAVEMNMREAGSGGRAALGEQKEEDNDHRQDVEMGEARGNDGDHVPVSVGTGSKRSAPADFEGQNQNDQQQGGGKRVKREE